MLGLHVLFVSPLNTLEGYTTTVWGRIVVTCDMTRLKKMTERRKEKKDAQIVRYVDVFLSLNRLAGVDAGFKGKRRVATNASSST